MPTSVESLIKSLHEFLLNKKPVCQCFMQCLSPDGVFNRAESYGVWRGRFLDSRLQRKLEPSFTNPSYFTTVLNTINQTNYIPALRVQRPAGPVLFLLRAREISESALSLGKVPKRGFFQPSQGFHGTGWLCSRLH